MKLTSRKLRCDTILGSGAIVLMTLVIQPAFAQETRIGAGALGLEEITVTAQRRVQSIQDVPISMSVFDSDKLSRFNVSEAQDYLDLSPNVHYSEEGELGSRSVRIAMRGIANLGASDVGADPISIFYDDVSINVASQGTANPMLHDVERVEVLRGPQGTYFGASAAGGALNIVTRKPTEEVSAEFELGLGNYGARLAGGVVNTPLTDNFFVRMVAYYEETPGVVKNVNPVGGDSSSTSKDFRVSARWLATEHLENTTTVNYTLIDQNIQELVATGVVTENTKRLTSPNYMAQDDGLGFYPHNTRYVNSSIADHMGGRQQEFINSKSLIATNNLNYTADHFIIEAITGYVSTDVDKMVDQDHIRAENLLRGDDLDTEAWSQEVRISSNNTETFEWVFGAIYLDSKKTHRELVLTDTEGFGPFVPDFAINRRGRYVENESFAAFADATWRPTPSLAISGGLRYSHDKSVAGMFDAFNGRPPGIPVPVADQEAQTKTDDFAPRLSVKYDVTDDLSAYAIMSKGYRPGGVRLNPGNPPASFDKEQLWNYEVGLKGMAFDNRLQLGLSLFYMDWKGAQYETSVFLTAPDGTVISTAGTENGDAESMGVEAEFTALVAEGLTLSGGVGYLHAKFKDVRAQASGIDVDLTGHRLPQAPKWTMNFAAHYSQPIPNTEINWFAQAEWRYRSEAVANLDAYVFLSYPAGTNPWPYLNPSYDVANLRLGIDSERFTVTSYVENVLNNNYFTGARVGVLLNGVMVRPHPRLFGLKAQFRF